MNARQSQAARFWPSLVLALALILSAWPAALAGQAAPTVQPRVLSRLPHDAQAFTQGLLLHQGSFYESTGLYGRSTIRRVEPATGRVLASQTLPARFFGEGLALCPQGSGARLIQLTWKEGRIFTYALADLRPLESRPLRGEGWGLACDGNGLWLSDGTDRLRRLDAASLAETGRGLRVRDGGRGVERLNELEMVNGWILANVWEEDRVAVIHPRSGQVALWLDLSALRRELPEGAGAANGVAHDPKAGPDGRGLIYLTGKLWDRIFAVEPPELLSRPPGPPETGDRARPAGT